MRATSHWGTDGAELTTFRQGRLVLKFRHMRGNVQYLVFFSIASLAASCASSGAGSVCDQANPCDDGFVCVGGACVAQPDAGDIDAPSNPFVDAGDVVDAGPMFDAAPKAGFGEPCSDKGDCESNICIFVNIGGICTETCVAGSCDTGFGCFGVFGAIDPGEVADVCVPESNQLCSPCQEHTECSIIGQDKCVPSATNNKQFCARDCSTVACPGGYQCQTVNVDGADTQQCIPNSGACDCNAALVDTTEACDLTTPFGTCQGVRTCQGAAGWGSCEPPSATDPLDGTFTDDNCDGIDGVYDRGIFVSRDNGSDASGCGLTHTAPCASIGQGLIESIVSGRNFIYVQASALDYSEIVSLVVGKHIYGGYDAGWVRDTHTDADHRVSIIGGLDSAEDQYMTIKAHGLIAPTTLADVLITGPTAVGTTASGTRGSYAVHVDNANLNLERVTIVAGNGANGSAGGNGFPRSSAAATSGMRGGTGGNAKEKLSACNTSSRGRGGAGANNSCSGGSVPPGGGGGGDGGPIDSSCNRLGFCTGSDCNAQPGRKGGNASWNSGSIGAGGAGGAPCRLGLGGNLGRTFNGAAGVRGGSGGFIGNGYWFARAGGAGGVGNHGSGGGGGGGSGGCDILKDSYGAGGGGGGAGGCRATSGGGGGLGGGGSFGVFAVNGSTVTASSCSIQRGNGGDGGRGGIGGYGQSGGGGGPGGNAANDSKAGGPGGRGGHGGHGGGGAGGSGGISAGVYFNGSTVSQTCTISGGSRGAGGAGGSSAPSAPVGERDGIAGNTGSLGSLYSQRECANPSGC